MAQSQPDTQIISFDLDVRNVEEAASVLLDSIAAWNIAGLRRHARLEGEWRDTVIVERLLGEAAQS